MPDYAWTWADVQRVNDNSKANPAVWKGSLGANKTRKIGGKMGRFLGGGAHFAKRSSASLRAGHPAIIEGRSIFQKSIRDPATTPNVMKSGKHNAKTGGFVTRGHWKGMAIYTLSLEERATCPTTCDLWAACYGNAMPYAHRHKHGPELLVALTAQLRRLSSKHQEGYIVRLHVLGDFYDTDYVQFWIDALTEHAALRIWGYTHWEPDTPIGRLVRKMNAVRGVTSGNHCFVRFSISPEQAPQVMGATTIWRRPEASTVPEGQICPASVEDSMACGTCGLCWSEEMRGKTIVFPGHGMRGGRKPSGQGQLL
jgi:hypothetical protein